MKSIESVSEVVARARVESLTWDGRGPGTIPRPKPLIGAGQGWAVEGERAERLRDVGRRAINVVVAAVLLVLALPIMVLVALVVRLTSRGPVIYVQERVGLDRRSGRRSYPSDRRGSDHGGRLFRMYKFRTMYVDQPSDEQVWARPDDPRVTPVGRFLRLYRLDELPQLVNVLKGDMNLVGPRPEQPRIFKELREEVDSYHVRQRVLPGITGWAQINNGYDQSLDDVRHKLRLDLEYLERRSALEDLRIMARTAPVMLFKQGAQ